MSGSRWSRFAGSFRSRVISISGLLAVILSSGCRPMSGRVCSARSESGMVEKVGIAVEIALPALSVQELLTLPVSRPAL